MAGDKSQPVDCLSGISSIPAGKREFDTKENYGAAQKSLYDSYWKAIEKCLVVPHDKYLGEVIF